MGDVATKAKSAKNDEWYTPSRYIEAARLVMGGIDLDPASCEIANHIVKASRYYTREENGLLQPWYGRVWLNPPYSKIRNRSGLGAFVQRLVLDYQHGNIEQAVLLVTTCAETQWYRPLLDHVICLVDHHIHFYKPGAGSMPEKDSRHAHFFGSSIAYLGENVETFTDVFSQFGRVIRAIDTPKPKPVNLELWEEVA